MMALKKKQTKVHALRNGTLTILKSPELINGIQINRKEDFDEED